MGRLVAVEDCLLLVIDAQPAFYGSAGAAEPPPSMRAVLDRIAWLAGVATTLAVPAVVTEEDAARNGPTGPAILGALPASTAVFAKHVFGAADQPDILAAINATGRHTAVLVGLETDVCVAHSALGLLDRGFRVAVIDDATYAPPGIHEGGLRRVVGAGAELIHAKGIYYEWVRTLDAARMLGHDHPELDDPPGFDL
jgi:nicotinamidase-related amidase